MFKNPFSFKGRIRRTEYGLSYLLYFLFLFFIVSLSEIIENLIGDIFILFLYIPLFWFILAQGTKRCHDRGNSGWFQIIPYYRLWMLFAGSDNGINEYGPNPKGIGNPEPEDDVFKDSI